MVKALIFEEEYYIRQNLIALAQENHFAEEIIEAATKQDAICLAKQHNPDIALFNIDSFNDNFNGLGIVKLLKLLHLINSGILFVFIPARSYGYTQIPIKRSKVAVTISSLMKQMKSRRVEQQSDKILILRVNNQICYIKTEDIVFLEKQGKSVIIHLINEDYYVPETLSSFLERLGENFIRVHKSFIINYSTFPAKK